MLIIVGSAGAVMTHYAPIESGLAFLLGFTFAECIDLSAKRGEPEKKEVKQG